ncbi:hypothetical protein EC991_008915 [Linnemannia zychae]|nr:hypothetical protein EC991_008915 [Linnemannia zychae]
MVSAQWIEDASPACKECLLTARNAQAPSCVNIPADPRGKDDEKMSLEARTCQCHAASSNAWIKSCAQPDLCNQLTVNVLSRAYSGIKIGCPSNFPSSSSSSTPLPPAPTSAGNTSTPSTHATSDPSGAPSTSDKKGNGASFLVSVSSVAASVTIAAAGAALVLL